MKAPTAKVNWEYKQSAPKTEPSIKRKSENIKRKYHLEPLSGALQTSGGTFKFQTFTSKYRAIFLKPLNFYVRPVSGTFMWNLLALMWNLAPKPSCGTLTRKSLCEAFIRYCVTNLLSVLTFRFGIEDGGTEGGKLFGGNSCGGFCGFVCQCYICVIIEEIMMESRIVPWASWEVWSFELSMVLWGEVVQTTVKRIKNIHNQRSEKSRAKAPRLMPISKSTRRIRNGGWNLYSPPARESWRGSRLSALLHW